MSDTGKYAVGSRVVFLETEMRRMREMAIQFHRQTAEDFDTVNRLLDHERAARKRAERALGEAQAVLKVVRNIEQSYFCHDGASEWKPPTDMINELVDREQMRQAAALKE